MAKPVHRLQIQFVASEIPNRPVNPKGEAWKILPAGQEQVFTFDSDVSAIYPTDHFLEGLDASQASGHCWYGLMGPFPYGMPGMSLRVRWVEVQYKNDKLRVYGMV